jgi:hypothetical protein
MADTHSQPFQETKMSRFRSMFYQRTPNRRALANGTLWAMRILAWGTCAFIAYRAITSAL